MSLQTDAQGPCERPVPSQLNWLLMGCGVGQRRQAPCLLHGKCHGRPAPSTQLWGRCSGPANRGPGTRVSEHLLTCTEPSALRLASRRRLSEALSPARSSRFCFTSASIWARSSRWGAAQRASCLLNSSRNPETSCCSRCTRTEQGPLSGAAATGRDAAGRPLSVSTKSHARDKTSSGGLSFLLKHYIPPSYPEGSGQPGLDSLSVEGIQTQTVTLAAPLPCSVTSGKALNLSGLQLLLL